MDPSEILGNGSEVSHISEIQLCRCMQQPAQKYCPYIYIQQLPSFSSERHVQPSRGGHIQSV